MDIYLVIIFFFDGILINFGKILFFDFEIKGIVEIIIK